MLQLSAALHSGRLVNCEFMTDRETEDNHCNGYEWIVCVILEHKQQCRDDYPCFLSNYLPSIRCAGL